MVERSGAEKNQFQVRKLTVLIYSALHVINYRDLLIAIVILNL